MEGEEVVRHAEYDELVLELQRQLDDGWGEEAGAAEVEEQGGDIDARLPDEDSLCRMSNGELVAEARKLREEIAVRGTLLNSAAYPLKFLANTDLEQMYSRLSIHHRTLTVIPGVRKLRGKSKYPAWMNCVSQGLTASSVALKRASIKLDKCACQPAHPRPRESRRCDTCVGRVDGTLKIGGVGAGTVAAMHTNRLNSMLMKSLRSCAERLQVMYDEVRVGNLKIRDALRHIAECKLCRAGEADCLLCLDARSRLTRAGHKVIVHNAKVALMKCMMGLRDRLKVWRQGDRTDVRAKSSIWDAMDTEDLRALFDIIVSKAEGRARLQVIGGTLPPCSRNSQCNSHLIFCMQCHCSTPVLVLYAEDGSLERLLEDVERWLDRLYDIRKTLREDWADLLDPRPDDVVGYQYVSDDERLRLRTSAVQKVMLMDQPPVYFIIWATVLREFGPYGTLTMHELVNMFGAAWSNLVLSNVNRWGEIDLFNLDEGKISAMWEGGAPLMEFICQHKVFFDRCNEFVVQHKREMQDAR